MEYNTSSTSLPPLPSYSLTPRPSMIPGVPDILCQLVAPIVAYWVVSGLFHILDSYDLCVQYRLHTPAELLKRNHVTKYEVFRDVIIQQVIQTITGIVFAWFDPVEMTGKDDYNVAVWALRLRRAETQLPLLLSLVGVNAPKLANQVYDWSPALAGALAGGRYSSVDFQSWELALAKLIYWAGVPFLQFVAAILIVDTWQYFLHRAMHMNKFLYTWLHSRHHRLYVPYAFGALYNHPVEGFLLDTLGTGLAYLGTGMTLRQGMWFFTCTTIKTVDDHCGYAFPWDPLQHVTSNNAAYHDVHHQSWGVKTNFSQPFFTFWDRLMGTVWTGGDVSARYERARIAAQKKVDGEQIGNASPVAVSARLNVPKAVEQAAASQQQLVDADASQAAHVLREEIDEEKKARQVLRRSVGRSSGGFDPKLISGKVDSSLYGKTTPVLHANALH